MQARHKRVRWMLLPALALFAAVFPLQQRIAKDPAYPEEYNQPIISVREGGTVAIMAMLGGFRPVVVNLLWLKSDSYWHAGATGWWRISGVLQTICEMDPHFIEAWSTWGWHCAWNIAAGAADQDKPKWVQTGINIYKRGISFNPDKYDLYKDLAWLYHDRLKDPGSAIPWWQKTIDQRGAPMYARHMLAHAYESTWQVDKAVATWKECLRRDPRDLVAKSAVDWWAEQAKSKVALTAELLRIYERENRIRKTRRLPMAEQPFVIR